jgi:hypothetical protein
MKFVVYSLSRYFHVAPAFSLARTNIADSYSTTAVAMAAQILGLFPRVISVRASSGASCMATFTPIPANGVMRWAASPTNIKLPVLSVEPRKGLDRPLTRVWRSS